VAKKTAKSSNSTSKKKKKYKRKPETFHEEPTPVELAAADDLVEATLADRYPPPKRGNEIFTNRWREYVDDIVMRKNFKKGHLSQLAILCDLHVEYATLSKIIKEKGYTFTSHGRNGSQERIRPEVNQRNKVVADIKNYNKMLGLLLVKDTNLGTQETEEGEEDSW
jgi:phage terminase small subunit